MGGDKLSHFLSFLVYGLAVVFILSRSFQPEAVRRNAYLIALLLLAAIGIADEASQFYRANRSPDILDLLFDIAGALAGVLIYRRWLAG